MDNALENFYRLLGVVESRHLGVHVESNGLAIDIKDKGAVIHALQQQTAENHDRVIFQRIEDRRGLERNIRHKYILLPYGKQVAGRNVLVERFYNAREMNRFFRAAMIPKSGSKLCVLCNRPFERAVGKLKQGVYPLATKNRALSGIRRKSDYIEDLCPTCFVIGVLEWTDDGLPYRCGLEDHSIVLFPHFFDFRDLVKFKKHCRQILRERDLTSNIKLRASGGLDKYVGGKYSALLLFLEQLIVRLLSQRVPRSVLGDDPARIICKDWVCLKVPSGTVKDVRCSSVKIDRVLLDVASSVIRLLQERREQIDTGVYSEIIAKIEIRPDAKRPIPWDQVRKLRLQFRELLAQSFLENDLRSFASAFLPRRGVYKVTAEVLSGVDILLSEWQFKPIGLNERDIQCIRASANVLAEVCNVNAGLLYQMDRAQTAHDFIYTLKEGAKKLVGIADEMKGQTTVSPSSLEDFFQLLASREEQWKLLRDALVLYTSIAYSSRKMSLGG